MPRRAHIDDVVDPTRARLATFASAPQQSQSEVPTPPPSDKPGGASGRREGQGGAGSVARPQRRGRNYLTVNRKVMIAEDEAERFADATVSISAAFGSQVTYSQITRARIIERRMARALFGAWGRPVAIGLLISLGIFAGSWGLTRFLALRIQTLIGTRDAVTASIEREQARRQELLDQTWGVWLHEADDGERYVVPPPGTLLDGIGWPDSVQGQPAVLLSRE